MTRDVRERNEHLFRAANESIQVNRHSPPNELLTFLCECSATDCLSDLDLTLAEYTSLRTDDRHFAVAYGHQQTDIERVVDEFDRYTIVEK